MGSADMTCSHLGHSVLPTMTATGEPRVSPCRTPPRKVTSSRSNFIRAPRPYPSRRRARWWPTISVVIGTPAGRPSSVATSAGPWDSPAVSQRNLLNGAPQCSRPGTALLTRVLAYGNGATRCAAPARHLRSSHVRRREPVTGPADGRGYPYGPRAIHRLTGARASPKGLSEPPPLARPPCA